MIWATPVNRAWAGGGNAPASVLQKLTVTRWPLISAGTCRLDLAPRLAIVSKALPLALLRSLLTTGVEPAAYSARLSPLASTAGSGLKMLSGGGPFLA